MDPDLILIGSEASTSFKIDGPNGFFYYAAMFLSSDEETQAIERAEQLHRFLQAEEEEA